MLEGRAEEWPFIVQSPVAFSRDGSLVATIARNTSDILLWDAATRAPRLSLTEDRALLSHERPEAPAGTAKPQSRLADVAFSPRDGALAAVRYFGSTRAPPWRVEFWDVRRRSVTNSFTGRTPLCTSQDGRWLACQGIEDGTIQFRDLDTGRTWTSQGGFKASPDKNQFAFSPDGRWLASTGFELVLWETAPDGRFSTRWEIRELLTLAEGSEAILDLQFCRTSEGEILGSSDAGGGVRLWRADAAP